jgi:hypothetical protein
MGIDKMAKELLERHTVAVPVAVEDGRCFMVREQDALDAIRAALAATGKQQGGEVQGDGLSTQAMFDAGLAALLAYRKSGGDYTAHPAHAVEAAINAALAARQSVGQEPVVSAEMLAAADAYHDTDEYRSNTFSDDHTNAARYRAMAAVAPPAQGIDLSKLRYRLVRIKAAGENLADALGDGTHGDPLSTIVGQAAMAIEQIDKRDAGAGVE